MSFDKGFKLKRFFIKILIEIKRIGENKMVFINSEGKFNDNSYLIDDMIFRLPGQLSLYIIENKGMRMMIDAGGGISC